MTKPTPSSSGNAPGGAKKPASGAPGSDGNRVGSGLPGGGGKGGSK